MSSGFWFRPWFLVFLIAVLGTADILLIQYSAKQHAAATSNKEKNDPNNPSPQPFSHPYVHTAIIICAELICLILFAVSSAVVHPFRRNNDTNNNKRTNPFTGEEIVDERDAPFVWTIVPGLCTVLASVLMITGLLMTHASVYAVIRGSVVLFTCWLAIIALGRKFNLSHLAGIFILVGGLLLLGAYSLSSLYSSTAGAAGAAALEGLGRPGWGTLCILCAQAVFAIKLVWCEYIFTRFPETAPLKLIGYSGVWALLFLTMWMSALVFLPLAQHENLLTLATALGMILSHQATQIFFAVNITVILFYQWAVTSLTKTWSATHVAMASQLRVVGLYISLFFLGWEGVASTLSLAHAAALSLIFVGWMTFHWRLPVSPAQRRKKVFTAAWSWGGGGVEFANDDEVQLLQDEEHSSHSSAEMEEIIYVNVDKDEAEIKSLLTGPPFQPDLYAWKQAQSKSMYDYDHEHDHHAAAAADMSDKSAAHSTPRWSRLVYLLSGKSAAATAAAETDIPTGPAKIPLHMKKGQPDLYKNNNATAIKNDKSSYLSKF